MNGCELIAALRKCQLLGQVNKDYIHPEVRDPEMIFKAARSYRSALGLNSQLPEDWPFGQEFWKPQDRLTNLLRAGVLFQEASERSELNNQDGTPYQYEAIEVSQEIDYLLYQTTQS